eukprot:c25203_g2_i5 orf=258-1187(+)
MAALDFLSPHFSLDTRPKKRPRLRWDDPGPSDEATRLQLQLASRFLSSTQPAVCSTHDVQGTVGAEEVLLEREFRVSSSQQYGSLRAPSAPWHEDDEDGHFNFRLGESLTPRYKILRQMGEGTFGRVLECWDRDAQELVAVKVVRSAEKYREAARIEVDMLRLLSDKDEGGLGGCVQIRTWFDYRNHICIVCEKLGPSLFDFLRTNNYRSFSIDLVQDFGRQILNSVAFMHSLRLIHTDLKPENVLLASPDFTKVLDYKNNTRHPVQMKRVPKSSRIKLIDFGSATYDREDSFSVVSTRHYRAPEVILG